MSESGKEHKKTSHQNELNAIATEVNLVRNMNLTQDYDKLYNWEQK